MPNLKIEQENVVILFMFGMSVAFYSLVFRLS